jgi:fused signal recognition particle receptor
VGLFDRLKSGLTKTKAALVDRVSTVMTVFRKIDDELFEELEEALIAGDVGVQTSMRLVGDLRREAKRRTLRTGDQLLPVLKDLIAGLLGGEPERLRFAPKGLTVILVVGVNGVGKTTTIGKLAYQMRESGQHVMLAAADTFRAAAIDQLQVWGDRAGVLVVSKEEGSDPASVAFDGIVAAKEQQADVLIIDTAGRLHNKVNLMEELNKITRVIRREVPEAPHETLLVLDATTGQNAVQQTKLFREAANVTGIALTKLDGTAKGGVVIAIKSQEGVPVKFVGVGESVEDLQSFDPKAFVDALFAKDSP